MVIYCYITAVYIYFTAGVSPTASIPLPPPTSVLQPSTAPPISQSLSSSVVVPSTPTPLPPFSLTVPDSVVSVAEGQTVSIICESSHPTDSLEWTVFGLNMLGPNASSSLVSPRSLELTITGAKHSSLYVCSATSAITGEILEVFVDITVTGTTILTHSPRYVLY